MKEEIMLRRLMIGMALIFAGVALGYAYRVIQLSGG